MKKLLLIIMIFIILFLAGVTALAQKHNSVYLVASTNDFGLGVRYDYSFKSTGIYASIEQGHYILPGKIRQHDKISLGVTQFNKKAFYKDDYIFISAGGCYHIYQGVEYVPENKNILDPLSLEIGGGIAEQRLTFAINVDVIKFDVMWCLGIKF
jgi:hypothetical protein